jgi:hypothetical protein
VRDSLEDVAAFFDVSIQTVERYWTKSGMPGGDKGPWDVREIAAWRQKRSGKHTGGDPDPMLDGPASPALERYREARAAMARLDLATREKNLLPRADVHTGLARIASVIRQAGDTLQKQFGAEPHAVLIEALDEAEQQIENLFGDSASEEQPDSDAQ